MYLIGYVVSYFVSRYTCKMYSKFYSKKDRANNLVMSSLSWIWAIANVVLLLKHYLDETTRDEEAKW